MWNWRSDASEMVELQILARNVCSPRVLEAMRSVPRHLFVPEAYAADAYIDRPLPIGSCQTISQPYMVAKMTELLQAEEGMSVLEIGTGSGYQTAILAYLKLRVYSIERIGYLAKDAAERLKALNFDAKVLHGDGREGYPDFAPYDRIIVTAAAERIEPTWEEQLASGGRMILPLNVATGGQRLLARNKIPSEGTWRFEDKWYDYCRFVPIVEGAS
ncbi:MAG: protein-L-isoaspartate(D-aspartate) O-methyltransferase [Fretibacterium sp.]|nr:protein-L-isoaspartate(D-aspartate) O-methyltransferase [Fretibacterium sp.]